MDLKIFAKTVDEKALQQINTLASIDAFKESKGIEKRRYDVCIHGVEQSYCKLSSGV